MSTTQEIVDQVFLEHFGVKGMKWGVRRDAQGRNRLDPKDYSVEGDIARVIIMPPGFNIPAGVRLGRRAVTAAKGSPEKQDARWQKKMLGSKVSRKGHVIDPVPKIDKDVKKKAKSELKSASKEISNKPEYKAAKKRGDLKNPNLDITKKYDKEQFDAFSKVMEKNLAGHKKRISPSGKSELVFQRTKDAWWIGKREIKHAIDAVLAVKPVRDTDGEIIDYQFVEDFLVHTAIDSEDFLEHYGVKGMRWGIRKDRVAVTATKGQSLLGKTKVATKGGTGQPATADAIKVAKQKQKLKKSGVAAMTNQELKELTERLRLEQQARDLVEPVGKKKVKQILGQQGQQAVSEAAREARNKAKKS